MVLCAVLQTLACANVCGEQVPPIGVSRHLCWFLGLVVLVHTVVLIAVVAFADQIFKYVHKPYEVQQLE